MKAKHTSIWTAGIAMMICAVFAFSAKAGDDGGARSVFAYGSGNRALGLGGAFAGIADDGSAPIWNAGGLGLVQRREFQITQTSYYGLGMNEQYASLVLPHWRWGTASLTFRHFSAGGIERRDDRNVLMEENLSDSESEFALGYGRSISRALSVGGTVKIRHHSLGEFSAAGVGMDLGVIGRPLALLYPHNARAERFSVGLSIRNALQPSLKLYREDVADPAGIRFGTAYLIPLFGERSALVAFDIEKTRTMDTRVHAGLELRVHPLLCIRGGINNRMFVTGVGIRLSGASIDYVFEQNEIDNVHRFGASLMFGRTVEQSRLAAIDERERELRAGFEAAFKERQAQRVQDLLSRADEEQRRGNYEEALSLLAVLVALEPGYEGVLSRQAACLFELGKEAESKNDYAGATVYYSRALEISPDVPHIRAAYEESRRESDRRAERSVEMRRMFDAALDAFSVNKLAEARNGFIEVLKLAPEDGEAALMLERTRTAIESRVTDLIVDADRFAGWSRFDDAEATLAEARMLDPKFEGLPEAQSRLARARERARQQTGADTAALGRTAGSEKPVLDDARASKKSISEEQKKEAGRLYRSAMDAMSQKRSNDAIRYLELVWSIDPGYQLVSEHLKREYLTRGMESFADGNLDKAVELWENALRIDPNDERAKGYLSRAREQASRTKEIFKGSM